MKKLFYILCLVLIFEVSYSQWKMTNGPGKPTVQTIYLDNDTLYAGTAFGLYYNTNNGDNWILLNPYDAPPFTYVNDLAIVQNNLFVGTNKGLFTTSDMGKSWDSIKFGNELTFIKNIFIIKNNLFVLSQGTLSNHGVFKSTDLGESWVETTLGEVKGKQTMARYNDTIYIGTYGYYGSYPKIYKSTNYGEDWIAIADSTNGLTMNTVRQITVEDSIIVAATSQDNYPYGLFISKNNGNTWEQIYYDKFSNNIINSVLIDNNRIFVGSATGLYLSTDFGDSWTIIHDYSVFDIIKDGNNILAASNGIAISSDNGNTWQLKYQGLGGAYVFDLTANGSQIFSSTYEQGIFVFNNDDISWNSLSQEINNSSFNKIAIIDSTIFAGVYQWGGLKFSNDFGLTWKTADSSSGLKNFSINKFYIDEERIYICTNGGIYLSSNSGNNWLSLNSEFEQFRITSLAINDNNFWIAVLDKGIYFSSDLGSTFELRDSSLIRYITDLIVNNDKLFVATIDSGIYISNDMGFSWNKMNNGLSNQSVLNLININDHIFAGTQGGIFLYSEEENYWMNISYGLSSLWINALSSVGENIYAATPEGVYKAKLSDFGIVDVEDDKIVEQNKILCYPNPASEDVKLLYRIETAGMINIFQTDVLGNKRLLKTEYKFPGDYVETFNFNVYPQGIYNIVLQTESRNYSGNVIINR